MDFLKTIGVMPGILGISWGRLGIRPSQGSSWCFDFLEAQVCRSYNLGYFGEGATKKIKSCVPTQGRLKIAKTLFFSELLF